MVETKGAEQDSHQEAGKAQAEKLGSTPGGEPEVFTKAQLEEAVQKARIQAGREAKTLDLRTKALDERERLIKEVEARREAEEAEAVKDDPDKLKAFQDKKSLKEERRKLAEDRAQLEADRLQHAEEIKAAAEIQRERGIFEVAAKFNVNPAEIKDALTELGIENPTEEQITAAAKRMGKPEEKKPLHVDSGKTRGGGTDTSGMSPDDKLKEGFKQLTKK